MTENHSDDFSTDHMMKMMMEQIIIRKSMIIKRMEGRQKELVSIKEEMDTYVEENNRLGLFSITRKKELRMLMKNCEKRFDQLILENKHDKEELDKLSS